MRFFISVPYDMVIEPDRQLMQASAVANQGLPRINGCPSSCDLGCKNKKLAGYSQESTVIMRSSKIPSGLIVDLSASYKMVGVGLRLASPSFLTVSIVITLIVSPKSISMLGICVHPICTMTVGFPRSSYLAKRVFPIINADNFPMTWTVEGSLGFLPGFFVHRS